MIWQGWFEQPVVRVNMLSRVRAPSIAPLIHAPKARVLNCGPSPSRDPCLQLRHEAPINSLPIDAVRVILVVGRPASRSASRAPAGNPRRDGVWVDCESVLADEESSFFGWFDTPAITATRNNKGAASRTASTVNPN